jgi:predicted alpha/beta hydrolase
VNAPEPAAHAAVVEEPVVVSARDGYRLAATLYRGAGDDAPDDVVVFNGGAGLAIDRYRHFLRFVAASGVPVLAYDYRGVGASRPARLRGFDAGFDDWADLDHPAAIEFVAARFPGARLAGVSHSIGCLVACSAPNAPALRQMVYIGPHTGYWRDYRAPWRWPMALVWHVAMPALTRLVGYFPGRRIGLGDDLPLRFALQWAQRTTPEFGVERDGGKVAGRDARLLENARSLRVPALAITMFDDAFVSEHAVSRFLQLIPKARVTRRRVGRDEAGGRPIGHFGFFGRRHAALWSIVTTFVRNESRQEPTLRITNAMR